MVDATNFDTVDSKINLELWLGLCQESYCVLPISLSNSYGLEPSRSDLNTSGGVTKPVLDQW